MLGKGLVDKLTADLNTKFDEMRKILMLILEELREINRKAG